MAEEGDAFYVVRKGDVIGIYKNFTDCQNQAGSSVCNPSVSVFEGHCLPKEAEEYLVSHGLKNASYTISASDVKDDALFGKLVACPIQQPDSSIVKSAAKDSPPKRLQDMIGSTPFPISQRRHFTPDNHIENLGISSFCQTCILEFDGASKGNPGLAGAGAVLRAEDGSAVYRLREGVGIATNNVAEYRAVILGLKYALEKGYKHIRVKGDSKLVCMQVQGLWKTKNQNMADLCEVAKELKDKFMSFEINHVLREYNSEADVQANRAINLRDGQVEVDWNGK
ncbi:uncharacterized protein LOC126583590 isoform X5 [Malus sylvestris]|uniref:uncharacterized protein LOC126583590 isoform X5 n=1 Tax=Malus sylvestris TaxID=3752 RepID=UPI000498E711|nr:uncharacterized protein LOC103442281 isoform X5 [Malus domestica]XP_050103992.1 uncharacterized protein LOC126583590 isoform X5 [Malus sylvestris]